MTGSLAQPLPSPSIWVQGYTGRRPVLGCRSAQVRTMGSDCSMAQKAPILRTHVPASCILMEQLEPGGGGKSRLTSRITVASHSHFWPLQTCQLVKFTLYCYCTLYPAHWPPSHPTRPGHSTMQGLCTFCHPSSGTHYPLIFSRLAPLFPQALP